MAEANQMAASEQAELFKKIREATKQIEVDFQEKSLPWMNSCENHRVKTTAYWIF